MILKFPDNFYWGTAVSSHQVEGNCINQWSRWEKENAKRLANNDLRHQQKDKFPQMLSEANYISGKAADHYNLFEKDFDILSQLNCNSFRFSIEWSRIEPVEGFFDEKAIEHYKKVINALRERKIEPFVTLYHWTLPIWVADQGGWLNEKTLEYFERFALKMVDSLPQVKYWQTINEPIIYAGNSYLKGIWPPQQRSLLKFKKVVDNLIKVHKLLYYSIHLRNNDCEIGIVKNNIFFEGNFIADLADRFWNHYFLSRVKDSFDYIGLNYYFHNKIKGLKFSQNDNKETTDMGWEIYPEGMYHVLRGLKKYKKPIYVTENGLADKNDKKRKSFIENHLKWIHQAIVEGVDVKGYFYWSLLDNFEWDKGFWPRFGLVEVDYETMERKIRESAYWYAEICKKKYFRN